ncbi:MAG TPA: hypothetical protein VK563_17130 [Puia sp.]|nr:hypothetical protein [Puia sp.]
MNNRLEQFIRDHREEFDADEPGKKVWENIQFQMDPVKKRETAIPVIWMSTRRWTAVAAVSLLMAGSVWYFSRTNTAPKVNPTEIAITTQKPAPADTTSNVKAKGTQPADSPASPGVGKDAPLVASATQKAAPAESSPESDYREEMYHYARLVELKHKELKTIEKDEPLLYKQFAGDVSKLDSTYRTLEKQLPENPNREQLLEAMKQNLELQMGLLNHQLDIIKQINHSKKKAYEKAYKEA